MIEDDQIAPNKRKRVEDSVSELQQIIKKKDEMIQNLTSEVDKLKGKLDELVKTMHGSFFIKDASNGNDIPESSQMNQKQKRLKKGKNKTSIENSQAEAEAGIDDVDDDDSSSMELEDIRSGRKAAGPFPYEEEANLPKKNAYKKDDSQQGNKSKSVPVFTTHGVNVKNIICNINRALGHKNYVVKTLGKNVANIGACTIDDYNKIRELLEEQGVQFYTYTPKGLRPFSLVIEGIPDSFESGEILEYLNGLEIDLQIIHIVKLGEDKWLLKMSRESDIKKLYGVCYILNCRVKIRKFEKRGITQCYNCQRFGHVSANCRMPFRCVKCAGSHGPSKCTLPAKGEDEQERLVTDPVTGRVSRVVGVPVRCANCGVEGHVASSKTCPRRLELLRKIEQKKASAQGARNTAIRLGNGKVVGGVSYAAAAKGASDNRARNNLSGPSVRTGSSGAEVSLGEALAQYDFIDRDCGRFFGSGLLQCVNRIGGFMRSYDSTKSDEERSRALLGMMMALCRHG